MDAATPNPIASTITKADEALITDWLEGSAPLTELCTRHNISLMALAIWSRRPDIVALMDSLREMHEARIKSQVAMAATNAIETLHKIAATPEPSLAQEISRRAAASILRLDAKLTPRSRQPRDRHDTRAERPTHNTPPTSLDGTTPATPPAPPEANQPPHPTRAPAPSQQPARIPRHQPQLQPAAKLHPARPDSVSSPVSPSNLDSPTTPAASPPKPPSRGRRPPRN
jgi:hypothetical protein